MLLDYRSQRGHGTAETLRHRANKSNHINGNRQPLASSSQPPQLTEEEVTVNNLNSQDPPTGKSHLRAVSATGPINIVKLDAVAST